MVAESKFLTFLLAFLVPLFSETIEWTCFEFTAELNLHKAFAHKRISGIRINTVRFLKKIGRNKNQRSYKKRFL